MAVIAVKEALALHLYSGVPVVEVIEDWSDAVERRVGEAIGRLVKAGHSDIILNLARAARDRATDRNWVGRLEQLAASMKLRPGRLNVVGPAASALLKMQSNSVLRWASSEEEAICRIKGVRLAASGPRLPMHWNGEEQ
ncbi:MAG TPA: hypothetical protein VGS41_09505 [Chthonomonadales bacterium]|nr:hypothetical protein [Chthonomonadales bacterium]